MVVGMNNSAIKTIQLMDGKTIRPQDLPPEAWQVVFGKEDFGPLNDFYSMVSWVFRGVDIRANAVKSVPFVIENAQGKIVDTSKQYSNVVGFLPHPKALFGLVEMALTVWGYSYLYKQPNILGNGTVNLRYLLPTDIMPNWNKDAAGNVTGLASWQRKKANKTLPLEDVAYYWKPDPFVEYGPPESSPLQAASTSAGVVLNADKFSALYFDRGAIRATLLAVTGSPPPAEKERIKGMWGRLFKGLDNAFSEMVINADSLKPIVIGDGLEAVNDKDLTDSKRQAIATALGIPHTMLFSSSASGLGGGGVVTADKRALYDETAKPECEFIQEVTNEQILIPAGYKLRFVPETMDLYQVDEAERAGAMSSFMDAITKAGSFEMAQAMFTIYGVEVSDEAMGLIEQHYTNQGIGTELVGDGKGEVLPEIFGYHIDSGVVKMNEVRGRLGLEPVVDPEADKRAKLKEKLSLMKAATDAGFDPDAAAQMAGISGGKAVINPPERTDIDRWRDKAIKAIRAGKDANVPFDTDAIPHALQGAIMGRLEGVTDTEQVRDLFADLTWEGYP